MKIRRPKLPGALAIGSCSWPLRAGRPRLFTAFRDSAPWNDRLLIARSTETLYSSPWTGASMATEQEFFLCAIEDSTKLRREKATVNIVGLSRELKQYLLRAGAGRRTRAGTRRG
jgi:hypothetical protein